jgi:hypothetical protein
MSLPQLRVAVIRLTATIVAKESEAGMKIQTYFDFGQNIFAASNAQMQKDLLNLPISFTNSKT